MTFPTPTELAYFAGFFDGEGCVQITRSNRGDRSNNRLQYQLRLQISQKNIAPLLEIKEIWGGKIYTRKETGIHMWHIHSHFAEKCLKDLLPFLKGKAEQAELGLIFQANRGKSTEPKDEQLYLLVKDLKG